MTSGLLFNFWLILVVFAIPQFRWELRNFDSDNLNSWPGFQFLNYMIYFALILTMLLLNCFADKTPRNSTYAKVVNSSPEQNSSFVRQIFFQWFDYMTWRGFKRPLTEKDIFDIHQENTSSELVPPFEKYFAASVEKNQRYAWE